MEDYSDYLYWLMNCQPQVAKWHSVSTVSQFKFSVSKHRDFNDKNTLWLHNQTSHRFETSFQTSYLSSIHFQSVFFRFATHYKQIRAAGGCCLGKLLKRNSLSLWHHKDPLAEKTVWIFIAVSNLGFWLSVITCKVWNADNSGAGHRSFFFFSLKITSFHDQRLILCPLAKNGSPLWNLLCYKAGKSSSSYITHINNGTDLYSIGTSFYI